MLRSLGRCYLRYAIYPLDGVGALVVGCKCCTLPGSNIDFNPHATGSISHHLDSRLAAAFVFNLFHSSFMVFSRRCGESAIVAYTVVAYGAWLILPMCLLLDRSLFENFVKVVSIGSALIAIPSYIGALGIDSIAGLPLSNKYSYSEFSGIIASGGILEHAEGHALQMAIGLMCSLFLSLRTGSILFVLCFVMTSAGLIVSQGRGVLFGVLIACAFWAIPESLRRSRMVLFGGVAFFLLAPFLIWPQLAQIPGFANYLRMERGLSGRDVAWAYAGKLIEEKPWVGHGFGTSGDLSEQGRKQLRISGYSGAGTTFHNTFITKAVELGLLVTLAYLSIYVMALWNISDTSGDAPTQQLIRSIILLTITASIFRDYNIGGVRSTSMLAAIFLGLANLWPFASRFATSGQEDTNFLVDGIPDSKLEEAAAR